MKAVGQSDERDNVIPLEQKGHPSGDEELARAQARIERLLRENRALVQDKENLSKLIDDLLGSASWKLTKPLRDGVALKRKASANLFPLWRNSVWTPTLRAHRDVREDGGRFTISGMQPVVRLESSGEALPTGWSTVECLLRTDRSHLFFYLYYIRGGVASEQDRLLLPAVAGEPLKVLCKLPPDTTSLHIQPFSDEGEFSFDHFRISSLGSVQVGSQVAGGYLQVLRRDPKAFVRKSKKAVSLLREGGITALRHKLFANQFTADYQEWVDRYDTLKEDDRAAIRKRIDGMKLRPKFSVIVPVYNVEERWLRAAIESVRSQLYPDWELCLADDASPEPHIRAVIEEYTAKDSRIKAVFLEKNSHISIASNKALELATGDYAALLDHDDELTEHALYMVAEELNAHPEVEFIYSDEDKKTSFGARFNPYFKSDWNPVLLLAQNFLCHLCVYKTERLRAVGGFRTGFEGAQDWDLALRVTDAVGPEKIRHIPHVLYHWRVIEGSTAQSTAFKPYVLEAQRRAVSEHLERTGRGGASVQILEGIAQLKVKFPVPTPEPLVSIVIPTRDKLNLVKQCVGSILKRTSYRNFEILIVDNNSCEPETIEYFEQVQRENQNVRVVSDRRPFNYSQLNNGAVAKAKGSLIGLLNNDLEVINPEWLSEMVSYAVQPQFGAVGARLLYPNGCLQHGGVILGINGVAGHNHKGIDRGDPGYFNRAILPQNLSAVTAACLIIRREIFDQIGGLDEEGLSVAFNDVDFCLKVRDRGYLNVYAAYAELFHYESASRGYETTPEKFMRFEKEVETMKRRWSKALTCDPYYNPNLTLLTEDFRFAFPPRAVKPWKT